MIPQGAKTARRASRPAVTRAGYEGLLWSSRSSAGREWTLQQLAPYIGRMKAEMARALIERATRPGDLVLDPFCGSGVVPFEAAVLDRRVVAGDWNPYAITLSRAKLFPPKSHEEALVRLEAVWVRSRTLLHRQDLRTVPAWVRVFFHLETLRSALAFRDACVDLDDDFLLGCLLSILHHQRPGFLSFPSSHLVPYLRDKKFPKSRFPGMYEPRDVKSRITAKIARVYARMPSRLRADSEVFRCDARAFPFRSLVQAVITSPPYMNELDYVRDNRLRLWFIRRTLPADIEPREMRTPDYYGGMMADVCLRFGGMIRKQGFFILVVGDASRSSRRINTADIIKRIFRKESALRCFSLLEEIVDQVPDIRRSRRECRGTKSETVLIYARR
jgi:hypothetical protein